MRTSLLLIAALALPVTAEGQRDFLTTNEIDQLRLTQEPNERLALYNKFALLRIDQIEQMVASNRTGRATFIHDLLEDYTRIIDAMDSVADDALAHKLAIDKGIADVSTAEKDYLARLQKIRDSKPKDLARYEFVLTDAIDTTSDSYELSQQDLTERGKEITAKEAKAKTERQASMTPEQRKAEAKENAKTQPKRKAPTLLKPGEKIADPNAPPTK